MLGTILSFLSGFALGFMLILFALMVWGVAAKLVANSRDQGDD